MQPQDEHRTAGPFHIEDDVYLDFQLSGEPDRQQSSICHELLQLHELSRQSGHLLTNIRKQHHDVAAYLSLLDHKIDLVARLTAAIALGGDIQQNHKVRLSADELSFLNPQALPLQSPLQLRLVIFPSHLCLQLQSSVIRCEKESYGFRIGVKFNNKSEAEHEALIRHLLERQAAQLRHHRSEPAPEQQ
ncbi:MAG: PilZ domain-containing protein [Chromatiales bacterium]|nr:PilZ domain-containing protein [Chromatiales bacterium]